MQVEFMRDGFKKLHLGEQEPGWWPVMHCIYRTEEVPHDHPFDIQITIVRGSYIEEIYNGYQAFELRRRVVGDRFLIPANRIHRIVSLPDGPCWSFAEYGPRIQASSFFPEWL